MTPLLNETQTDMLKEFGHIGSAHAATSLSIMIGRDIDICVPDVRVAPLDVLGSLIEPDEPMAALYFQLLDLDSQNDGHIYLLFPDQSARRIVDVLLSQEIGSTREISETERSALMEVGNILISSFGDASAELLGMGILPSPPSYRQATARRLIEDIPVEIGRSGAPVIIFKTSLSEASLQMYGYLLLLPEPQTLDKILLLLGARLNG